MNQIAKRLSLAAISLAAISLVVFAVGCGSDQQSATKPATENKPFDERFDFFKEWDTAKGQQRLTMIEKAKEGNSTIEWLRNSIQGRTTAELTQIFGEPDHKQEETRQIAGSPSTHLYYYYFYGKTTQDTPKENWDVLSFQIEIEGRWKGLVKNYKLKGEAK